MSLGESFATEVSRALHAQIDGPELLPMTLAKACVRVLPVAGAGLSMTDELRVPLGSSDLDASRAERLQTTLGEGPCLAAVADGGDDAMVFNLADTQARWPMFYREIIEQTPYRSFASVPLRSPELPRFGALDLYSTQTTPLAKILVEEVADSIADTIAGMLFAAPVATYQHGVSLPTWLNVESVTYRMNVWVAVGMLMEHTDLTNTDALSVLRAFAFSQSTTLDDIAKQITNREVTAETVLA